jgi:prepilin-type processing-associated H-X9-DG protein
MKSQMRFSKKDVVVVLGCAVFALATLGAVGSSGRRRAKEAVCLSNLGQWGAAFHMFTEDNDGYFMQGWTSQPVAGPPHTHYWMEALRPYYGNVGDLRLCPEATKMGSETGAGQYNSMGGTDGAWGYFSGECGEPSPSWSFVVGCDYGSYGINAWVHNIEAYSAWPGQKDIYWRVPNVAGADNVPLFGDHKWLDCWPHHTDAPPDYDGQPWPECSQMGRVCMNRHNGFVNWVFLDGSARKVGLKCLWKLQWHRDFRTDQGPTEAEFNSAGDGWMREFPRCW